MSAGVRATPLTLSGSRSPAESEPSGGENIVIREQTESSTTLLYVKHISGVITDIREDEYHLVRWTGSVVRVWAPPSQDLKIVAGLFVEDSSEFHLTCVHLFQLPPDWCGNGWNKACVVCRGLLTCSEWKRGTLWVWNKRRSYWLLSQWQEHSDLKAHLQKNNFQISHNSCISDTFFNLFFVELSSNQSLLWWILFLSFQNMTSGSWWWRIIHAVSLWRGVFLQPGWPANNKNIILLLLLIQECQ